jgi:hypothetical protein
MSLAISYKQVSWGECEILNLWLCRNDHCSVEILSSNLLSLGIDR